MKSLIFATVAASAFALGGTDSAEAGSFYFGIGSGPYGTQIYGYERHRPRYGHGHWNYYPSGIYRHERYYYHSPGPKHWNKPRRSHHGHHHHHH